MSGDTNDTPEVEWDAGKTPLVLPAVDAGGPVPGLPTAEPVNRAAEPRGRLTVVESVYHQTPDGQPAVTESRYGRWLASTEQSYVRRLKVGPGWERLDTGWVTDCSQVVVINYEGAGLRVNPTPAERDAVAALVVQAGVGLPGVGPVACHDVPPGESCRFRPTPGAALYLRCPAGVARVSITAVPA